MASVTWIMKDILLIIHLALVLKILWDTSLYYETPPSFIIKAIIMRYFKFMRYLKVGILTVRCRCKYQASLITVPNK